MNLLEDPWIPVRTRNDQGRWIAPWQITEGLSDDPIVAIDAPRADFTGALMQFLIGLLQTAYAPEREKDWIDAFRHPPDPGTLQSAFADYREVFHFGPERPSFMEDFDLESNPNRFIAEIFLDGPGENTRKKNKDFFVKRSGIRHISPKVAAMAILTLQINAPGGGTGFRTSIRGGGPLTTIVVNLPKSRFDTLWHNIWLNILTRSTFKRLSGNPKLNDHSFCFPWMALTRVSDKNGQSTTPEDAHPLTLYWAMPWRIRFGWEIAENSICDVTGENTETALNMFTTKNYGTNYEGAWFHPLSPYRENENGPPIPEHPRAGGFQYRHWLRFISSQTRRSRPAKVVEVCQDRLAIYEDFDGHQCSLWAFGYDMGKATANCWYESLMPLFYVDRNQDRYFQTIETYVSAASLSCNYLQDALLRAWFGRHIPSKAKKKSEFVNDAFWQSTERPFYSHVHDLAGVVDEISHEESDMDLKLQEIAFSWLKALQSECKLMFNQWAATGYFEAEDPRRISIAHNELMRKLNGKKLRQELGLPSESRAA